MDILAYCIVSGCALFFAGACAHYLGEYNRLNDVVRRLRDHIERLEKELEKKQ